MRIFVNICTAYFRGFVNKILFIFSSVSQTSFFEFSFPLSYLIHFMPILYYVFFPFLSILHPLSITFDAYFLLYPFLLPSPTPSLSIFSPTSYSIPLPLHTPSLSHFKLHPSPTSYSIPFPLHTPSLSHFILHPSPTSYSIPLPLQTPSLSHFKLHHSPTSYYLYLPLP